MFETSDITLAASLVTLGIDLKRIKKERHKNIFIFEKTDLLEDTISDFLNNRLMVPAKEFHNTIKHLVNI